jgi:hypothetical protein
VRRRCGITILWEGGRLALERAPISLELRAHREEREREREHVSG